VVLVVAVGCSRGHGLASPEGIAVSPDGRNVYAAAFESGGVDVFDRRSGSGTVVQKPGPAGCVAVKSATNCAMGRRLGSVSSVTVSPDGENVYATAFARDAIAVFARRAP
jgi:DNA-binding beta-propeller fold protein YncE